LIQVYNSLVRSIFEYSAITLSTLSKQSLNCLQVIQNCALRSIFYKPIRGTRIESLHELRKLILVRERWAELLGKYVVNTLRFENKLMIEFYLEYLNYSNTRNFKSKKHYCATLRITLFILVAFSIHSK
jgi:hypothetical protein